jgi:hypothetical protein
VDRAGKPETATPMGGQSAEIAEGSMPDSVPIHSFFDSATRISQEAARS